MAKTKQAMAITLKAFFLLLFLFCGCEELRVEYSYDFPSLSSGQLIDLKKTSEALEGFFMTTDMSDFNSSWANRGFYLYTCVRFLNDAKINKKINRSAVPLLVQVSDKRDKPKAEAVVLLHPKTNKVFYHIERRSFNLQSAPIQVGEKKYLIHDVRFNEKGKITGVSFVENSLDLDELKELLLLYGEDIYRDYAIYTKGAGSHTEEDKEDEPASSSGAEDTAPDESPFLEVGAFAKLFNSSCENWSMINYEHDSSAPDYLKVQYTQTEAERPQPSSAGDPKPEGKQNFAQLDSSEPSHQNNIIPEDLQQYLIPEDEPYTPIEKSE